MSILLVAFIFIILSGADHLFISPFYPVSTACACYILKYSYLGIVAAVLLKNPGIMSIDRSYEHADISDDEYASII